MYKKLRGRKVKKSFFRGCLSLKLFRSCLLEVLLCSYSYSHSLYSWPSTVVLKLKLPIPQTSPIIFTHPWSALSVLV